MSSISRSWQRSVAKRRVGSSPRAARRALGALEDLRATRYSHVPLRRRIWELRKNVTPYDAAYVALAEGLGAPLVTVNAALGAAARPLAQVELQPSP
jgi:predicted nucleic acid-binding protein